MATSVAEVLVARAPWLTTRRAKAVASSALAGLVAIILAGWVGPQPMHLGFQANGDSDLAARVRTSLGADGSHESTAGYRAIAVATVMGSQTRWAGLGNRGDGQAPTNTTAFELGSITKLFTGLMLADAVDRAEVKLEDTLDMYLPALSGTLTGGVTLEELATHRSGLPAYADDVTGATYEGQGVSDVASISASDVVDQAAGLILSGRGTYQYSNLGVTLLGDALAAAVGAPSWVWLVNERVLKPAGMRHTVFAAATEQVPTGAAVGNRVDGVRTPYSVGAGYFPAGTATFTTASDLAAFARWILDGKAIGMWAMQPRYTLSETDSIGLVWMSTTTAAGTRSWHNGSVPGFTSVLRLDLADHRAVAVLGNTDSSVELLGNRLLDPTSTPAATAPWTDGLLALLSGILIVACVFLAARMQRWYAGAAIIVVASASLVLLLRYAPWQNLPGWIWAAAAAAAALASLVDVRHSTRRGLALSVALAFGAIAAVAFNAIAMWVAG